MAVRITSLVNYLLNVPGPIEVLFEPRQVLTFEFIEYDSVINDERIHELMDENKILVEDLEPSAAARFVSQWNLEPKLRLLPYVFWVDATGALRMKNGDPTFDLDGVVIGPGGAPLPHGPTHVFTGSDPVPDIEVLEDLWTCPAGVNVRDAVYQNGANTVGKADATSSATTPVIGLVLSKPTATTCIIARSGDLAGFAGLTADRIYFASDSTPGGITLTPPTGSGKIVQRIGYSRSATDLIVQLGETRRRA